VYVSHTLAKLTACSEISQAGSHFAIIGLQLSHSIFKDRAECFKTRSHKLTDCLDTTEAAAARSLPS
jgi:hypothetical protein